MDVPLSLLYTIVTEMKKGGRVDDIKNNLIKLREGSGLTQEALAPKLNVSRSTIAKWESGKGTPNIENLNALSALFIVSLDTLLNGDVSVYEDTPVYAAPTEKEDERPSWA